MDEPIPEGTVALIDGVRRIYYDGYWLKAYEPPADSLDAKKRLIQALTRRLFNHVEHGINIPGKRLEDARRAYESEEDPARKRVKGAMYAGAMFNRATDIFTKLVELQELGIEIATDNPLMRECGGCLQEARKLGRARAVGAVGQADDHAVRKAQHVAPLDIGPIILRRAAPAKLRMFARRSLRAIRFCST